MDHNAPDWRNETPSDDLMSPESKAELYDAELVRLEAMAAPPSGSKLETGLGLFRDVVVAAIGLLVLFGVNLTEEQVAGILLVLSTAAAFGTWAWRAYRAR